VGEVTAATTADQLRLTGHPLQRCGARAAMVLVQTSEAGYVSPAGLDAVADTLTKAIVCASAAPNDAVAYDWWKVLFALYPNSPATHSKRSRDRGELSSVIGRLFAADPEGAEAAPCAFCGLPAAIVWGKDRLPMFDSVNAVNTLPPGLPGWPVCRGCRIAMWALPYGAWVTRGSATVLTCPEDAVETRFIESNVERAKRIQLTGFDHLPANASPETVTLSALLEHGGRKNAGATLWMFQNNNEKPWLRVTATRGGIPRFLRAMFSDPACRAGWGALKVTLTQRDKDGAVKVSGAAEAAKTLFDQADRPGTPTGGQFQHELLRLAVNPEKYTARTLIAWRSLCRLYLEVIYQMDVGQVTPARELITGWIMQSGNPRSRYTEYASVCQKIGGLQQVMIRAAHRLLLDGQQPADVSELTPALLAKNASGWRLRGQLYFEVVAKLVEKEVPIGVKAGSGDPDDEVTEPGFDTDSVSGPESGEYFT
jgi:CRISPR-associated protein Cst1